MVYPIDYALMLAAGGPWATLANQLNVQQLASENEFNALCKNIAVMGAELFPSATTSKRFLELLKETQPAEKNKRIPTPWGGVYVISYDETTKDYDKYLIVKGGNWLAFEKHSQKLEKLVVELGIGILLFRDKTDGKISMRDFQEGATVTFQPGEEHCLIAINDLVVRECGVDHKGMDQDLIFIYMPPLK